MADVVKPKLGEVQTECVVCTYVAFICVHTQTLTSLCVCVCENGNNGPLVPHTLSELWAQTRSQVQALAHTLKRISHAQMHKNKHTTNTLLVLAALKIPTQANDACL